MNLPSLRQVEIKLPVPSRVIQITKATHPKVKGEKKSIFVFLTEENAEFMNPGFFFP